VSDLEAAEEAIETTLDAVVAHGDILEQQDFSGEGDVPRSVLLYAAPPSFVARSSGAALLLGITPDQVSPLPEEWQARIEYVGHVRRLPANVSENLHTDLVQLGLIELSYKAWLRAPAVETPAQYLARMDALLESAAPSGEIPGLTILDSARPVRYYRGRWAGPKAQSGRFVARRSQAYGADLWCYVSLHNGHPVRFIDLPPSGSNAHGCDEAWRLQLAIDAKRGQPQVFMLSPGPAGTRLLKVFSPVPGWAIRRWDAIGESIPRSGGCLFAYRLPEQEIEEELRFLGELWLSEAAGSAERG
jgi:hypothetical protein